MSKISNKIVVNLRSVSKSFRIRQTGASTIGQGIYRVHARVIPDNSIKQLKLFFEDYISEHANIITDGWLSYKSLQIKGWKITQKYSNGGKNFDALYRFTISLKATLEGIYDSVRVLQAYLDEYVFKLIGTR